MYRQKFIAFILLFFSANIFVTGQTLATKESPTAEKNEKEKARLELETKTFALVERIASDAAMLKLPENRAFLLAMAGDLLWKQDQKRSQKLFRDAASELVMANAEAEKRETDDQMARLGFYSSPRRIILQTVARRDADLALDLLVQTRSPKVAAEMQRQSATSASVSRNERGAISAGSSRFNRNDLRMQAQEELRLEQSLIAQAAEQDPKRAAKLIRDSLAKGVSNEALNLVRKIQNKDTELANALLAEITQKIIESDFTKPLSFERQTGAQILRQFGGQTASVKEVDAKKQLLKADDQQLRDLANKTIDNLLKPGVNQSRFDFTPYYELNSLLPVLEKLTPERAAALRQKQVELKKNAPEDVRASGNYNLLNDSNATPEQLISAALKMPDNTGMRGMFYRRTIDQLAVKGGLEQARQSLVNAPTGKDRDEALVYLNGKLAEKAAQEGKYDEARKLIAGTSTKSSQIEQLVKLALVFHAKNDQDNREIAARLMDEARAMINTPPEDADDLECLVKVAAGYAVTAPERSFTLLEPLVDQANELAQAAALLAKFQKGQSFFRDGELLITMGIGPAFGQLLFLKELGLLAAADFERTRELADRFQRNDLRILARLLVAQSILREQPNQVRMTNLNGGMVVTIAN